MIIMSFILGSILLLICSPEGNTFDSPLDDFQESQTAENPPFEPPASNVGTVDSGSTWVNGQEIFWRYFFPNTSMIQPRNFGFSFEAWWKNPDPGIVIVVDLSENEGESSSEETYDTLGPYEKVLETPEGDFLQYAIWMNTTYFFANETWASFGNESIDVENLNLTVGIQHDTYFPIFEFSILRDTGGPSLQIIHPNYNEGKSELVLDWSDFSFEIIATDLSDIVSATLVATFMNQTTFEPDELILWGIMDVPNGEPSQLYVPPLITERVLPNNTGLVDIDTASIPSYFLVVDAFGYETRKRLTIIITNIPDLNTTTTTPTTGNWETMIPIVGSVSIVGVAIVLLGMRRTRK